MGEKTGFKEFLGFLRDFCFFDAGSNKEDKSDGETLRCHLKK
jgi:hypothetical protein